MNTITGQIQGLAISEPAVLAAQEAAEEDEEGVNPREVLEPQRVGLGECLNDVFVCTRGSGRTKQARQ